MALQTAFYHLRFFHGRKCLQGKQSDLDPNCLQEHLQTREADKKWLNTGNASLVRTGLEISKNSTCPSLQTVIAYMGKIIFTRNIKIITCPAA